MDQVRVALAWIKQHHFWLLCGFVALASTGTWYYASSELSKSFKANSAAIKSQFTALTSVRNKSFHPNEAINRSQRDENRRLADEVRSLWSELYGRQREEVLQWPERLGADFVRFVGARSFGDAIPLQFRKRYQNYIQDYYPELPRIIDALEDTSSSGRGVARGGGRPGRGGFGRAAGRGDDGEGGFRPGFRRRLSDGDDDEPEQQDYLVVWEDQERIRAELEMLDTPSALRMWVTQEDLWVYETLLRSIATVNTESGADRYSNAAIRDIYAMEVGRLAAENQSSIQDRIYRPEAADGEESADSWTSDNADESQNQDSNEGEGEEFELLGGRYVDGEGKPLRVSPEVYEFGTEFKRLPVRLEMQMDQRWLPMLISELSNAPLQVEVAEVRINVESSGGSGGGRTGRRSSSGFDSTQVAGFSREPAVGTIVISGIVYIYNPVDEDVLSVDDDSI